MARFTPDAIHQDLKSPDYVQWKAFLAEAETWPASRIEEYQLAEINRVLALAWRTPGYASLYKKHGLTAAPLRNLDEIRYFPLISKEDIRDNLKEFTSVGDFEYVTTGGSTGIPFGLYRSKLAFAKELASKAHQYHRIGWKEGDRQAVLRGLPIQKEDGCEFFPQFNELRLSSYHLVPERMRQYVDLINEYRPDWLRCYPSSAQLFAQFLEEENIHFPFLKGVLCASENLYPNQADLLRRVYGGRIYSHYGHYELAVIAGFCAQADTYHVLPTYGFAELIDVEGNPVHTPGEIGEIIGTSFILDGTILVRYRTNDYAVHEGSGCPHCGLPYQIWRTIEGRLQDFIVTSTGRLISMTAINMHDDIFDSLRQFQFEQSEAGRVVFKYIPRGSVPDDVLEGIRRRLHPKLGDDIKIAMVAVDDIPLTKRGKHRFLIQHIPLRLGDGARHSLFLQATG